MHTMNANARTLTAILALVIGGAILARGTPATDRQNAYRLRCELQTAAAESLDLLTWQQGTTPRLSLDQFRNGRAVDADLNGVAVVRFGPSATNTYYVTVTNYAVSANGYLVQIPTVGTNTVTGSDWWYTAYIVEPSGYMLWTGNGRLRILKTTSTEDGLVWQTITSYYAATQTWTTNQIAEAVAAEAALRVAGDVKGTNYTDAVASGRVPTNDAAYLAACTGSVFYAGVTTFVSNRVVWIGTNISAGATGPQGPQGPPGTNGAASSVFATNATYAVTVTGPQSNLLDTALQPGAIAECVGGYAITNWWEPSISAIYRATSAPTGVSTSSYVIYSTSLAESGFVDWLLDYTPLDGWIEPPTWAITDGTNHAYIATNRVWALAPGRVTVSGTGGGITRDITLPINYGKIATPITSPARFVPGSAAAIASDPIITMASNYLATTTDVLYPRPNSWNTNEMARTNYAAVIDGTWNTNCWLTNAASVFACASYAGGWGATLISPTVFVSSRHINIGVGSTRSWLTPSGAVTSAVISRVVAPFPWVGIGTVDIQFGVLDRPMPTNMVAYVATQAQLDAAFPAPADYTGQYLQGVAFNQHLDAALVEIYAMSYVTTVVSPKLLDAAGNAELFHPAHPGDSSRPIFLLWGNKPVFLANYYYATYGSSIARNIAEIAAVVEAEGESLTYIDFEEVP